MHITLIIRIFHWSLVVMFVVLYTTGITHNANELHEITGYLLTSLIISRIVWGVIGNNQELLKNYIIEIKNIKSYLASLFAGQPIQLKLHNPLGSAMVLTLLICFLIATITGILVESFINFSGIFMAFALEFSDASVIIIKHIHSYIAHIILLVVIAHISGVLISSYIYKFNFFKLMIKGRSHFVSNKE